MDEVNRDTRELLKLESGAIVTGAIAGFLAAIPMGLVFQFGTDILPVLGAFLGEASVFRGWIVHLVIAVGYGASFAFFMSYPPVHDFVPSLATVHYVAAAVTYTVMVAAFTISVLPFVLELPWEAAEADPLFPTSSGGFAGLLPSAAFALAHIVFGIVLGFVYAVIAE